MVVLVTHLLQLPLKEIMVEQGEVTLQITNLVLVVVQEPLEVMVQLLKAELVELVFQHKLQEVQFLTQAEVVVVVIKVLVLVVVLLVVQVVQVCKDLLLEVTQEQLIEVVAVEHLKVMMVVLIMQQVVMVVQV